MNSSDKIKQVKKELNEAYKLVKKFSKDRSSKEYKDAIRLQASLVLKFNKLNRFN